MKPAPMTTIPSPSCSTKSWSRAARSTVTAPCSGVAGGPRTTRPSTSSSRSAPESGSTAKCSAVRGPLDVPAHPMGVSTVRRVYRREDTGGGRDTAIAGCVDRPSAPLPSRPRPRYAGELPTARADHGASSCGRAGRSASVAPGTRWTEPKEAIMSTSRRDFLATSLAALVSAAFAHPGLARALARPGQEPAFTAIRRGVGYFTMRGGTIGYLVNDGGVVVVDTQFPEPAQAFLKGLAQRAGDRPVDVLLHTHHPGDHTGGNGVFRGVARTVVAHEKAAEHMRQPPGGGQTPEDQLFPDTTFTESWSADVGDERITARYYGRAHTSGDAVITFERANV